MLQYLLENYEAKRMSENAKIYHNKSLGIFLYSLYSLSDIYRFNSKKYRNFHIQILRRAQCSLENRISV